jgi:hypothetical protein
VERLELLHIEAEPGDALFFDGNLLHRSDQNRSDDPRWSIICCYNAARNSPYKVSRHPAYSPLSKVGPNAIREWSPPPDISEPSQDSAPAHSSKAANDSAAKLSSPKTAIDPVATGAAEVA